MNFDATSKMVAGRRPRQAYTLDYLENMDLLEQIRSESLSEYRRRTYDRDPFWLEKSLIGYSVSSTKSAVSWATLVKSCSRYMSLPPLLKQPEQDKRRRRGTRDEDEAGGEENAVELQTEGGELAERRIFHETFSLLIEMGSAVMGCRRKITREEQVRLKDLIWLELQAKLAGRTLAEQGALLCTQRKIVPDIVHKINNYVFVNPNPCRNRTRRLDLTEGSNEDLKGEFDCLSFNCQSCTEAIGKALLEVGTLLDSFYSAGALYPSSHCMRKDQPLIATPLFEDRHKAMCQWYNSALHLHLKILAVRRMIRGFDIKDKRRQTSILASTDESDVSSDSSAPGEHKDPTTDHGKRGPNEIEKSETKANFPGSFNPEQNAPESNETGKITEEEQEISAHEDKTKEKEQNDPATPGIVINNKYGPTTSSESRLDDVMRHAEDVFDISILEDMVPLRLLKKRAVSIYRTYYYEILKTQGVRRCMQFMNKMNCNLLQKVLLTLEKPDVHQDAKPETMTNDQGDDKKEEENKTDTDDDIMYNGDISDDKDDNGDNSDYDNHDDNSDDKDDNGYVNVEEAKKAYELRRYGCWSEECLAMRLPSYRAHFLLLSSICMEAAHDYLSLRLEDRPQNPSCLTVKQLIHELKEGLDIATEMRAAYARNIEVALQGQAVGHTARNDLLLIIRTFDATVELVVKQYLSYLCTMSEVEQMGRSCLQTEWAFTARLARRVKCAALLASVTFSEIAVNQLNRLHKQFEQKFDQVIEQEKSTNDPNNDFPFALCRAVQLIYASECETAVQAVGWARALAARLARAPAPAYRTQRQDIFESLMRIRHIIVEQTQQILCSQTPPTDLDAASRDLGARIREPMLQIYRLGFKIHKELHRFVNPPSNDRSVEASPPRWQRFNRQESAADDKETNVFDDDDQLFENINTYVENQTSIELLLTGELPRLEETVDLLHSHAEPHVSEQERQWATRVACAIIEFAECWMMFVIERCDTGRGLRPTWANQGLDFLKLACDPCNTKHLTTEEFEDLKKKMDLCMTHVIGSRPARAPRAAKSSPNKHRKRPSAHSPVPNTGEVPAPPDQLLNSPGLDTSAHSARVLSAVEELERSRDQQLREKKAVGNVVAGSVTSYEPKLRQLKLKWQRGLMIGTGTFGKVYKVNTENDQFLAMKELSIGAGDRPALLKAANELKVLEGIKHKHLVRFYGCELHRDKLLIFMELCVEGSLEALIATSGALAEHTTRRYTRQLVAAVTMLHASGIAHRDIKSGNIFLTNEGHCLKLGDFGCAVKIRANTTAAGELIGLVGTQAYMAPEVFVTKAGHGRAADIWSLGCVVTEMASGKRPFSEFNAMQMIYKVGMGERPAIPDSLSLEGQEFCRACLTHEPETRPRAEALQLHHFLKIKADDEDCNCEPAYLILKEPSIFS